MKKLSLSDKPGLCDNAYQNRIGKFKFVYNPLSLKGPVVLNQEACFLLSKVNGQNNLSHILKLARRADPDFEAKDLLDIFKSFVEAEIVYFKKPKSLTFPKKPSHLGAWLQITNQCNLRCKYCYVSKSAETMPAKIYNKAILKIISDSAKHGYKKITFKFSGGECLLEFDSVLKIVKLARKLTKINNIEVEFVILTNGTLITNQVAAKIKEKKIKVSVSLDGLGKEHDQQRMFANHAGSFKYVEKGINNLCKENVLFNVSVTITSKNLKSLPELTTYLLNKKIPFVFNFYRPHTNAENGLVVDKQTLIKYLKKAYGSITNNLPEYSLLNGLLDRVSLARPHTKACGAGESYLVVLADGKISSCQMTMDKPIGSIADDDLIDVMHKGSFNQSQTNIKRSKNNCNTCRWRHLCCGGCPLMIDKNEHTPHYCDVYKMLIPEILKLESQRLIKYANLS